ncbi:unnamed protein product [Protopolystoma xenopodis]|uniref:Uncharacterized protein n=1 Tax=Protopolystoma xenopodis TaxID=117903 RepID=A0A448XLN3_9PLAT|nr:unnamed protein product [Protopolystoma xenopodis]
MGTHTSQYGRTSGSPWSPKAAAISPLPTAPPQEGSNHRKHPLGYQYCLLVCPPNASGTHRWPDYHHHLHYQTVFSRGTGLKMLWAGPVTEALSTGRSVPARGLPTVRLPLDRSLPSRPVLPDALARDGRTRRSGGAWFRLAYWVLVFVSVSIQRRHQAGGGLMRRENLLQNRSVNL